jgi:hypothetical protein
VAGFFRDLTARGLSGVAVCPCPVRPVLDALTDKLPQVAAHLDAARTDILAFTNWFRRSGLLVAAEGEAGGADVVPAVPGVNGSVPLAG